MRVLTAIWLELRVAFIFLTRLPLPPLAIWPPDALAGAVWAFPFVGVIVGGLCAALGILVNLAGLPVAAVALLILVAGVLTTGALHEDGLADVADGIGGGRDVAHKLAIMKDSRIGSYGALALMFSLGLRGAALSALVPEGGAVLAASLIAAHAASRSAIPLFMWLLPLARQDGAAAAAGRPRLDKVLVGLVIGGAILMTGLGWRNGLAALAALALVVTALMIIARRQIGGYTGDVLGAAQQMAEIAILLAASNGLGN